METEPLLAEYLTEETAADELNVSTRTLKRWRDLGGGPPITHLGRRILYHRGKLKSWLAARTVTA